MCRKAWGFDPLPAHWKMLENSTWFNSHVPFLGGKATSLVRLRAGMDLYKKILSALNIHNRRLHSGSPNYFKSSNRRVLTFFLISAAIWAHCFKLSECAETFLELCVWRYGGHRDWVMWRLISLDQIHPDFPLSIGTKNGMLTVWPFILPINSGMVMLCMKLKRQKH